MAGSTLPPISAATAGVLRRLGEEMASSGEAQLASHLRIGQVTAVDTATVTATVAYGAGANLVAIAGHYWLAGHEPAVNDYVMVASQDGDNWIVGKLATAMSAPQAIYAARVTDPGGTLTSFFTTATDTAMRWTTEQRDDGNLFSSGADTRLTLPVTGWWAFDGLIHYSGNQVASGTNFRLATTLKINGSLIARDQQWYTEPAHEYVRPISTVRYCSASDYLELFGYQNSGAAMSVLTSFGESSNHLAAYFLGA